MPNPSTKNSSHNNNKSEIINITRKPHVERTLEKIKTGQLVTRLQKCALGKVDMTMVQLTAAKILIDKKIPTLKHTEVEVNVAENATRNQIDGLLLEAGLSPESVWDTALKSGQQDGKAPALLEHGEGDNSE